jgi:hypothetical protein
LQNYFISIQKKDFTVRACLNFYFSIRNGLIIEKKPPCEEWLEEYQDFLSLGGV